MIFGLFIDVCGRVNYGWNLIFIPHSLFLYIWFSNHYIISDVLRLKCEWSAELNFVRKQEITLEGWSVWKKEETQVDSLQHKILWIWLLILGVLSWSWGS